MPRAIKRVLPEIAKAIDVIADCFAKGGRLILRGHGNQRAHRGARCFECPPTFGTSPEMVQFLIAGGESALVRATEASEDSSDLGQSDMAAMKPGKR